MNREVLLRSTPVHRRQQPLLTDKARVAKTEPKPNRRLGEVAGGTAAECAAVCCCCPCTVMNLVILAVYKVPAGLCRKAWNKNKRQRLARRKNKKTAGFLQQGSASAAEAGPTREELTAEMNKLSLVETNNVVGDGGKEAIDKEKEMWDQFFGGGFWRSPSQREESRT